MNSSLDVSRAAMKPRLAREEGRVTRRAARPRSRDTGPWRVAGSLVLIAFGITFGVALARLHYGLGGEASADGLSQGFVLSLYERFGFAPSFYFFLLVTIWGLLCFFGASVRVALRRLAVAVVFVASFAALASLMGGQGGAFGSWVAERLSAGIGNVVTFLILAMMSVMSLLLATDWFFFSQFRALREAPKPTPRKKSTATKVEGEAFRPAEVTGANLRPVPVSPGAKGYEKAKTEQNDARLREQALVDRVLEEARLELSATQDGPVTDRAAASAVLAPPSTQQVVEDEVDPAERDAEIEERRLALRARRAAARAARAEGIVAPVEERVGEDVDDIAGDDADDADEAVVDESSPHESSVVSAEEAVDAYHTDGLHPDEELGLAGLLEPAEPFSDLDNDDLLAKAGEAMEKQWQSGGIGFAREESRTNQNDPTDTSTPAIDAESRDEIEEAVRRVETSFRDPFSAEPDRALRASKGHDGEESHLRGEAGGRDEGGRDSGDADDDDEKPIVIEPLPSRRPMPEEAPVEETPEPAETTTELPQQQILFGQQDEDDFVRIEDSATVDASSTIDASPPAQFDVDPVESRLDEAAQLVLTARRPTPSLIQRRLGVDGVAARRLLDQLAGQGAVAEPSDGGAWYPLVSYEDWTARSR